MERRGCEPDHVVWPEPGDEAAGVDRQLDRAVDVLLEAVKAAEAHALPPPRYAAEREDAKRAKRAKRPSGASED
jgi:hypothetical protein